MLVITTYKDEELTFLGSFTLLIIELNQELIVTKFPFIKRAWNNVKKNSHTHTPFIFIYMCYFKLSKLNFHFRKIVRF